MNTRLEAHKIFEIVTLIENQSLSNEEMMSKIETVGKSAPKQNNDEQQYQAHVQERASAEFDESSLPF